MEGLWGLGLGLIETGLALAIFLSWSGASGPARTTIVSPEMTVIVNGFARGGSSSR